MLKNQWQQTARLFHERADEYDSWYDNSLLFDIELAALQAIRTHSPEPRLEIGVGPGRFAAALDVETGIDPAFAPLQKAGRRGVQGILARGEEIPLISSSVGTIYIILTLCFINRPSEVINECHRVLKSQGSLVLAFIPSESSWGTLLRSKGEKGHPYYRYARFRSVIEITNMLQKKGFTLGETYSTLFQPPETINKLEDPRPGLDENAGFCVLIASK